MSVRLNLVFNENIKEEMKAYNYVCQKGERSKKSIVVEAIREKMQRETNSATGSVVINFDDENDEQMLANIKINLLGDDAAKVITELLKGLSLKDIKTYKQGMDIKAPETVSLEKMAETSGESEIINNTKPVNYNEDVAGRDTITNTINENESDSNEEPEAKVYEELSGEKNSDENKDEGTFNNMILQGLSMFGR